MLLKQLEMRTDARLQKTEVQRLKVRRDYAPRVARLSLESRSLKDFILHGMSWRRYYNAVLIIRCSIVV